MECDSWFLMTVDFEPFEEEDKTTRHKKIAETINKRDEK
jgi:hypothetical protein